MNSKLLEMQAMLASTLKIAVSDLDDVPEHVLNQNLSMCILDDLSPLDLSNKSVKLFIKFITLKAPEKITVREIRDAAKDHLTKRPNVLVANVWDWVISDNDSLTILESQFQCDDTRHLNQLLKYIGGKNIEESYRISVNEKPKYHSGTEYSRVSYSMGISYTYFANFDYSEPGTINCNHSDSNMLRLLSTARLSMQEDLIRLVQYGDDPDAYAGVDIHYISIYMNGIEILQLPIGADVDDLYKQDIDLKTILPNSKVIIEGENFKDLLLSGSLFKSKEYRWLTKRLNGRHLEAELGM